MRQCIRDEKLWCILSECHKQTREKAGCIPYNRPFLLKQKIECSFL